MSFRFLLISAMINGVNLRYYNLGVSGLVTTKSNLPQQGKKYYRGGAEKSDASLWGSHCKLYKEYGC
jgi:hypothetical protein